MRMADIMRRNYDEFFSVIDRLISKHNKLENATRCYGLEFPLTGTEIHVLDEIGRCPGIGIKGIAINKGVTEGATSQLVKKLIKKGLVKKQISEESEAKVNLTLTAKGKICYKKHKEYHEEGNRIWYETLDSLEDKDFIKIKSILLLLDENREMQKAGR